MKFETQKDRPLIPAGDHILKLVNIDPREMDDLYGKSTTGKVTRVLWQFVSQETDDDGTPYEYGVFTNDVYGNEKARMTLLVDMLSPGMTVDKFNDFDCDDLVGKKYRAQIKHVKKQGSDVMKATHIFITPITNKPRPAETKPDTKPAALVKSDDDEVELDDPFSDQ